MNTNYAPEIVSILNTFDIKPTDTVVLCDIDGTIFRDSLFIEMSLVLIDELRQDERYMSYAEALSSEYHKYLSLWKQRVVTYDEYLHQVINMFVDNVKGLPAEWLKHTAERVVKNKQYYVYLWSLNFLKTAIAEGHKVILVSGSPLEVAQEFAYSHGLTGAIGTIYLCDEDNNLTGERIAMHASNNKYEVLNFIKENYSPKEIVSIGDTQGDFLMLMNSDRSYSVNPSAELVKNLRQAYEEGNAKNHTIVIERKDLALEIPLYLLGNFITFLQLES